MHLGWLGRTRKPPEDGGFGRVSQTHTPKMFQNRPDQRQFAIPMQQVRQPNVFSDPLLAYYQNQAHLYQEQAKARMQQRPGISTNVNHMRKAQAKHSGQGDRCGRGKKSAVAGWRKRRKLRDKE
jgi:hypothetical protein